MRRHWARPGGAWLVAAVPLVVLALVVSGQRALGVGNDQAAGASSTPTAAASDTPAPAPEPKADPTPTAPEPPAATADPSVVPPAPVETPPSADPTGEPTSPTASPTADATPTAVEPSATPSAGEPSATPSPTDTPAPVPTVLMGGGSVLATIAGPAQAPTYREPGQEVTGAQPFDTLRFDVQVNNFSAEPLSWTPRLEYRTADVAEFAVLPDKATPGSPLHVTTEWVKVHDGTKAGPTKAEVDVADAHLALPDGLQRVSGRRASGLNPDVLATVPATSSIEQEFTLAVSIDAAFGATYEVRVTDAGTPIAELGSGTVVMAASAGVELSPGQRKGSPLQGSVKGTQRTVVRYALFAPAADLAPKISTDGTTVVDGSTTATIHQPFASTTSGECATCHSTHRGESQTLLPATSQSAQCLGCHGSAGLGGQADVQSQFAAPANDPATRSYYSHDLGTAGHTLASDNEFEGTLNRHSQCSDCHNPHDLTSNAASYNPATSTWTPSGSYGGVNGVDVTNGAAGAAPSYTLLDGVVKPVTAEYQLCLKCHSGFTNLPANDPNKPSRDFTDVGKAFNPDNRSYHPVEAPGKNQTTKMAASLAGTSQYKIWNLATTDTIRCVMCHTSGTTGSTTAANAALPAHGSANRGILIRPYEDRVLSAKGAFYNPAGFALCLTCHAETPFLNPSGPGASVATNFVFHGLHVAGIAGEGDGGMDIDTPGAGRGNALCAECHFRDHAVTDAVPGQTISGDRLVNFAPDVTASKSMKAGPIFTKTATRGTCTLTCHGKDHEALAYVP